MTSPPSAGEGNPQQVPMPQQYAFAPAPPAKKKRTGLIAGLTVSALVLAGVGFTGFVAPGFFLDKSGADEIVLTAATDIGRDPFSTAELTIQPDPGLALPVVEPIAQPAALATTPVSGGTAGLYGGSLNDAVCDTGKIVEFLGANPDKAAAWVKAVTADPAVQLRNGQPLTVQEIPQYLAGLTSVVLTFDTRATNHGFENGEPTAFQAVLQKGTAVLVDQWGVPRARCYCANPLAPAVTVPGAELTGNTWEGFDPQNVQQIDPSPEPQHVLVLTDIGTLVSGTPTFIDRAVGTSGNDNANTGTDPNVAIVQQLQNNPPQLAENTGFTIDVSTGGLPINTTVTGNNGEPSIEIGTLDLVGGSTFVPTGGNNAGGFLEGYYTDVTQGMKATLVSASGRDAAAEVSARTPRTVPGCTETVAPVTIQGWSGVVIVTPPCMFSFQLPDGSWQAGSDKPSAQYGLNRGSDSLLITFSGGFGPEPMMSQALSTFTKK